MMALQIRQNWPGRTMLDEAKNRTDQPSIESLLILGGGIFLNR